MSTVIASAPAALPPTPSEPNVSPKSSYPVLAPLTHTPIHAERSPASATPHSASTNAHSLLGEGAAQQKSTSDGKRSPNS